MNRRDIIKRAALLPFIGTAIAKAGSVKTTQKISLGDILKKIVVDEDYKTYIESVQKVFNYIFEKANVDAFCYGDPGFSTCIYIHNDKVEENIITVTRNWFNDATPQGRIEYTKFKLKYSLNAIKNKAKLYAKINETILTIDLGG